MYNVAIVGATGLVGKELISTLETRNFPVKNLDLYASLKSSGTRLQYKDSSIMVRPIEKSTDQKYDFAFFSAGESISKEWAPKFAALGARVIDNTNAFRMNPNVALVVPEVNPNSLKTFKNKYIIANPNCSTIQLVVALKPLDLHAKIRRVVVSTYQSVSGMGKEAIDELSSQIVSILNFKEVTPKVFPHQIAFNLIPHIDSFDKDDYTKEEMKMIRETSKIMGRYIPLTATCVRVPTFACHAESVNIEFEKSITPAEAKSILRKAPGIKIVDDIANNQYPLNTTSTTFDDTFVGRIREDKSVKHGLNLWIVSDNLRKGAALNAIQIAEHLSTN